MPNKAGIIPFLMDRFPDREDSLRFYGFTEAASKDPVVTVSPAADCHHQLDAVVDALKGVEQEIADQPTTLDQAIVKVCVHVCVEV
jgi:hypothetical protein